MINRLKADVAEMNLILSLLTKFNQTKEVFNNCSRFRVKLCSKEMQMTRWSHLSL